MTLRAQPAAPVALELQPAAGAHRSIYRLDLPYPALPDASIVLTTSAPLFQRHIALGYERAPDRGHRDPWFLVMRSVEWSRGEGASNSLTLAVTPAVADVTQLTLVIDEGDNSALPIAGVQLMLPAYRLRFLRPASAARVVYGSPAMDAPRYDLALLAPSVLHGEAAEASMAAEAETPAAAQEQLISPKMFWVILAVAVIALLGVLAALLRKPV
jgi:F0F1-type ATP synthase membrane subunit c/vacuolar-type H+-ATPase subunit K